MTKFKHISHTGYYAGEPICGAENKADENNTHVPYVADLDLWASEHVECIECLAIFKDDE
jgi:hypothetical protein